MPYTETITVSILETLGYANGLPVHLLCGYAANTDFWVDQLRNVIHVIDDYPQRFQAFRNAQERYARENAGNWRVVKQTCRKGAPARPTLGESRRKELRAQVVEVAYRFLGRCYREGLLTESLVAEYGAKLDLDLRVLLAKR